jgi:hypothetical protein
MPRAGGLSVRTRRIAVANLAAVVALLGTAGAARADQAAISVTTAAGQSDAVAYIPRIVTVSGTASTGEFLYVKHRAAGGAPCAPSAFTDSGTWVDPAFYGVAVNGPFSVQRILTWRAPGTWTFCFWLADNETELTTPMTQTITVRSATGSIGASMSPDPPRAGDVASIIVAGSSEAPREVFAKIRRADGGSCGPTFDTDPGGAMIGGWSVDGAFSIKANVNDPVAGDYLVCMWLAGSSSDATPVAGPQAQTFTVVPARHVAVSAAATLDCRKRKAVRRFRASKVKSVCMRYRFASTPFAGDAMSIAYVSPRHRTYKTIRAKWPAGSVQTYTGGTLPLRAYKHRRGIWRAILRVDGRQVNATAFRVT